VGQRDRVGAVDDRFRKSAAHQTPTVSIDFDDLNRGARAVPSDASIPHSSVVVVGRLQQWAWTAENGGARSLVEVVAEELGPSLRWATATPVRASGGASE
jgi:hypothetical protein